MAMWINWYPIFETGVNYAYTYKNTLNKPIVRVESEKLKNIFKCKEVIGEITLQVITNQTYYIKYDNNFLKTDYPQRLYLVLIYDKTQCKTIKFKRGNLYIKINTEKGECESDSYTTISDELELINDVTSYGYANTDIGIKLPISQFTLTEEFGIEYNLDPYIWTTEAGESWTPSQLKFSSMVNYSNILTEDDSDSGDSTLLPETSNAAGAEHFLQDDDDYCYIEDNEGNIVYNKLLNQFARKTKINNGYRINRNQSLELLSFGNNIYDINQKTEGQFLFSGNKKQKYGLKKDDNVNSILQQNIPYFGGQPAIYPIVLYDNSNTIDDNPMSTLTLTVTSQSISFDNQTWRNFSADEDLLVAAIRCEGEWTAEKAPNWKIKRLSGETEVNMAGKNDTFYFEVTDFAQKGTLAMKDFEFYEVEPGSYTIYQENKIEKMPFTKKIENSAIKNLYIIDNDKTWDSDIKYVSDHAIGKDSSGRTAGKNFKIFLGQYNDDKETWQDHLNLKMNFQVNNIHFIKPYSSEEKLFYRSGEPSEKEGETGSQANNTCTAYVSWDIQNRTDSDNLNHDTGAAWSGTIEDFLAIGRIQRIFYAVPGSFPSFISYFPTDDKKHIINHNTISDKIEWYKIYSSQQHLNYDSQNDSNNSTSAYYNYKYRLQRGGGTYPNAWSVYLKVGYINNAYRPYALALILIKNGKLLNI